MRGARVMMALLKRLVRAYAFRTGRLRSLYVKLCQPCGFEYADFLRRHGELHHVGEKCSILAGVAFLDPRYTSIGNNVHFADCTLIGHDGSVGMMEAAYGVRIDKVGKIDIRDNVFIGHNALILPGVTIGPDAIVAAGAVVVRDVEPDTIVAGVPAKAIGKVSELLERRVNELDRLPWAHLIRQRGDRFDPVLEEKLKQARVRHFFGARD